MSETDVDVLVCLYCETPNGEIHHPLCDVRAGKPRLYKPQGATAMAPTTVDRAALVTWLRAVATGEVDITPDVESLLTAMSAALDRRRQAAPLTPEEAIRWVHRRGLGTPSTKWGAIADALCEAYRGEIPAEVRPPAK